MGPLPRALGLATLVTAAATAGCAHGGLGSDQGWSAIKTKHFTVYAGTPRHTQLTVDGLEYAYAALRSSFFKGVDLGNVDVLYLESDDYGEVVGFRRPSMAIARLPGSTTVGANGLLVLKEDLNGNASAEALTHLFIEKRLPKAALWFHEGFSSYARTVQYRAGDGKSAACFGALEGKGDTLLPLDKLGSLSWDEYDGDEARSWYKYTGRVLIDYTLHGENGSNREKISPLIQAVAEGQPLKDVIAVAYPGQSFTALDKKLRDHAAETSYQARSAAKTRGLCPLPFMMPAENAPDLGPRQITPAAAADVKSIFDGIKKLPRLDGYPLWYPPAVIDHATGVTAATHADAERRMGGRRASTRS